MARDTIIGTIARFMPGRNAPGGVQTGRTERPYAKKKKPVELGPPPQKLHGFGTGKTPKKSLIGKHLGS